VTGRTVYAHFNNNIIIIIIIIIIMKLIERHEVVTSEALGSPLNNFRGLITDDGLE